MSKSSLEKKMEGEFYTPTKWVVESHNYLSLVLGDNWRQKYIVWDPAAGQLNLTRGYQFSNLYSSTIDKEDVAQHFLDDTGKSFFQFDFLNDDIEKAFQAAEGLQVAFTSDKPILFFMNPPYATSTERGVSGQHKEGVAKSMVNLKMKKQGYKKSSQQLYAQFLYRILELKRIYRLSNVSIAMFSPSLFLTGASFKEFRSFFFQEFKIKSGFLFPAQEFLDLNSDWAISFSVIESGCDNNSGWNYEVKSSNSNITKKRLYNVDNCVNARDWARAPLGKKKANNNVPQFSSALVQKTHGNTMRGSLVPGALGYFMCASNNIYENQQQVSIFSAAASKGNGFSIVPENILRVCALFTARKTFIPPFCTWLNQKDEYTAPNEQHDEYKEFLSDSLVYSLFNMSSSQASFGGIVHQQKEFDIRNHFFWEHPSNILNTDDAVDKHPNIMYKLLEKHYDSMSIEAKKVLEIARDITSEYNSKRPLDALEEDNLHLQLFRWDAGYRQLKPFWKKHFPEHQKQLDTAYLTLENKLRPQVYSVGFLRDFNNEK